MDNKFSQGGLRKISGLDDEKQLLKEKPANPSIKFKAEHTVESGEKLSDLASNYYGSVAKENWMAIYYATKDMIGANPNVVKQDQVLNIPEL